MEHTHYMVSCDPAIIAGKDYTSVSIFKIKNEIPYLAYYEKDGVGVFLGDCDEMMTGVLLHDRTIMSEGSNFKELQKNLKALETEYLKADLRNGL